MAANMDGVGELSVAEKLNEYGMITSLTKQHDIKKLNKIKILKRYIQILLLALYKRRFSKI